MAFSTFNSIQSFLNYVRARVSSGLASYTYNFPALDPSLVLYYPLDISANLNGNFQTANYASQLPVYDASLGGSPIITLAPGTYARGIGDLSLNNTLGSTATNYIVANNTFAPNISGGFSISLWFSCSGQLNKTGTLISLPRVTGSLNGLEIDVSGTNMICTGYKALPAGYQLYFKFGGDATNYGALSSVTATYSYSGTVPNPGATIAGKTCLTMYSSLDYVYFPAFGALNTATPPANFTICCWVYLTAQTNTAFNPFSIGDRSFTTNNSLWQTDVDNSGYYMAFKLPGTWTTLQYQFSTYNNWHHMAWTISTVSNVTTVTMYRNGSSTGSVTGGNWGTTGGNNYNFVIGRNSDTAANRNSFIGCGMREFLYYNRTLTAAEILQVYNLTI
jgi:hypothetical protein